MTFKAGQEVLWTYPKRSEPKKAVLIEHRDGGWWLVTYEKGNRWAHERELSPVESE